MTGWLFQEMQDLFYYMQILHQGENSPLPRKASSKISVTELPNLMRLVGFYPTEYAVRIYIYIFYLHMYVDNVSMHVCILKLENMKYEVKKYYTIMSDDPQEEDREEQISFEDLLKLYINHRPSVGVAMDQLKDAFHRFASNGQMKREKFVDVLCNRGTLTAANDVRDVCMYVL